jgi:hypothetical protein
MKLRPIILSFILGLVATPVAQAQLLSFDFIFYDGSNEGAGPFTNEPVVGEIIGLLNNTSNQAPQNIIITSDPNAGITATPISFAPFLALNTTFTVSDGQITGVQQDGSFTIDSTGIYDLELNAVYFVNPTGPSVGYNGFGTGTSDYIQNSEGFAGVIYTAAPEPTTWALLLGGLGLVAFFRLRTRRVVS